jgi:hypothetical protein
MPKPENTPGRPPHAGNPDQAPGKNRPIDPDTGKKQHPAHPHGGPPGQQKPRPDRPADDDQGGEGEGETGGVGV